MEFSGADNVKKSGFRNYVTDKPGKIQRNLPGTKTNRVAVLRLLKFLKELQ